MALCSDFLIPVLQEHRILFAHSWGDQAPCPLNLRLSYTFLHTLLLFVKIYMAVNRFFKAFVTTAHVEPIIEEYFSRWLAHRALLYFQVRSYVYKQCATKRKDIKSAKWKKKTFYSINVLHCDSIFCNNIVFFANCILIDSYFFGEIIAEHSICIESNLHSSTLQKMSISVISK